MPHSGLHQRMQKVQVERETRVLLLHVRMIKEGKGGLLLIKESLHKILPTSNSFRQY
jgi:hypothetical protein